jgi:thermostable 8-oxoguanine DNA glycosylase
MYLCLKDMSYEESGRSIAAAIRILNTIAITHDQDEKDNLLKKIQAVSKELSQRIQEATNVITSMAKVLDAQTKLRDKLKKNLLGIQMEEALTKPATLDSFVTIVPPEAEVEPVKKTRGRKPKPA